MIEIPLRNDMSLKIGASPRTGEKFPTTCLQKGLILACGGRDLDEEGVGFGVPLLKKGWNTIFPGSVELSSRQEGEAWVISAVFTLNLTEKIRQGNHELIENGALYGLKNGLAAAIRNLPAARKLLTSISDQARRTFNWETTYALAEISETIKVEYRIDGEGGKVTVLVDAGDLSQDVDEVVVMNELGARAFDVYKDSSGLRLNGDEIECWDEIKADQAWFSNSDYKISFSLCQIGGARLFRGRELIGSRLAWAGFGYSFPASKKTILYEIGIEKKP
jgi:hypothetical protein